MDTGSLSNEAYKAVLIQAEKLSHDLTLWFGILAGDCANEEEYLDKAKKLAEQMIEAPEDELIDLFWGNPPPIEQIKSTCRKIIHNIVEVENIPFDKRTFEF